MIGERDRLNIVVLRLHRFTLMKSVNQWRYTMKKVNLRELYQDIYKTDSFVEVTDDVEMVFKVSKRLEEA